MNPDYTKIDVEELYEYGTEVRIELTDAQWLEVVRKYKVAEDSSDEALLEIVHEVITAPDIIQPSTTTTSEGTTMNNNETLAELRELTAQYVATHTLTSKSNVFALLDLVKILTATTAGHRTPEYVADVLKIEICSKLEMHAEKERVS